MKTLFQNKDTYTLRKPVRLTYRRRRTSTVGIDDLWQADLADLSSLSKFIDKNKYLLTCIDVFSKHVWVVPLKSKTGPALTEAFSTILSDRRTAHLQTDKGTEFLYKTFQTLLLKNAIKFHTTENSDTKASVAERLNRTLETKMWKYFTYKNSQRFIDVLQNLVHSYNNTYHISLNMIRTEVNVEKEDYFSKRLYGRKKQPPQWKYALGDKVRISKAKQTFKKG